MMIMASTVRDWKLAAKVECRRIAGVFLWIWTLLSVVSMEGGVGDWQLIWADEFAEDGAPSGARWGYDTGAGGWGNAEAQTYTTSLDNARVEGGRLVIEVQQIPGGRAPSYTSARLQTREQFSFQYGRVEVRARMPRTTGTWSAIWMLSTEARVSPVFWPDNGEIDIMEHVGYEEDPLFLAAINRDRLNNVHSTLHTNKRNHLGGGGIGGSRYLPTASTQFHTYSLEWDAEQMIFAVDGDVHMVVRKAADAGIPVRNPPAADEIWQWWPFDQPFHLILNVAVGGSWGGHFNTNIYPDGPYGANGIDDEGEWPQRMEVEFVRVYQRGNNTTWQGYVIDSNGWVNTGEWLGSVYVAAAPNVYSDKLQKWLYIPASNGEGTAPDSTWMWLYK